MTIPTQRDIRVTIISRIWAYATMMFLISILLSGQRQDRKVFLLPATIVFGAAISTIIVLRKLRDYRHDALFPSEPWRSLNNALRIWRRSLQVMLGIWIIL